MIPARISPAAANDLLDIADYLEQESFAIALGRAFLKKRRLHLRLSKVIPSLAAFAIPRDKT
jgi:plasmid stabilization system protein ParE